jgi:hypothetical protein
MEFWKSQFAQFITDLQPILEKTYFRSFLPPKKWKTAYSAFLKCALGFEDETAPFSFYLYLSLSLSLLSLYHEMVHRSWMLKSVFYSEVLLTSAFDNYHWIRTWGESQSTFNFSELAGTSVWRMTFYFCGMAATHQFSIFRPLIAITLWRRSDFWFMTFLGIRASESRGVRVEQDYEHWRHRSRQMRKVVISSKSVYIFLFPSFVQKIVWTKIRSIPYF